MPLSKMQIAGLRRVTHTSYSLPRPTDQRLVHAPQLRRKRLMRSAQQLEEQARATREAERAARERARDIPLPHYVPPTHQQRTASRSIPRRIIQSWCNRNLTPGVIKLCASHRHCNPGYEYVFYDDKECRDFIKKHFHKSVLHAYDALIPGAFKADLFRYCELYINGGWWFDIDMLSVGSIDAFVRPEIEFACPRDAGVYDAPGLYQALLGCSKLNPILARVIREVVRTVASGGRLHGTCSLILTGPRLLGKCVADMLPNSLSRSEGNKCWINTKTWEFGESRLSDGFCLLDKGVICIGHVGLQNTAAQISIYRRYRELKGSLNNMAAPDYRALHEDGKVVPSRFISQAAFRPDIEDESELRKGDSQKQRSPVFAAVEERRNIPDRVFQTHKDQATISSDPRLQNAQQSWKNATKDYRFYDDRAQAKFMRDHFPSLYESWNALPLPVIKADVWRYAVVFKFGGVYADADTVFSRPDTSLLRPPALLVGMPEMADMEADDFCNWWFAAPAGSPILRTVLELVEEKLNAHGQITPDSFRVPPGSGDKHLPGAPGSKGNLVHELAGPAALTEGIRRWATRVGWTPPDRLVDWEMNEDAGIRGLRVYRHHSIHNKVVTHLFSGQWKGGWVQQRREYTRLAHCFGMARADVQVGSYRDGKIKIPANPHGGLHGLYMRVRLPKSVLATLKDRATTVLPCPSGGNVAILISHGDDPEWLDMRVSRPGETGQGWQEGFVIEVDTLQ